MNHGEETHSLRSIKRVMQGEGLWDQEDNMSLGKRSESWWEVDEGCERGARAAVSRAAFQLAQHCKSNTLEVKVVQLYIKH